MAIKVNASSQGGGESFKRYVGVASFRVLGVNPTKAELEKFYGREQQKEPVYLTEKLDAKDNNKPYKQLLVAFLLQADDPAHLEANKKNTIECNAALDAPVKAVAKFFIDSRYAFSDSNGIRKVQVVDKYGRFAWVPVEQAKNHQIPMYSNGPAKLDPDYRPAYVGEEALTKFIINFLNVTPIETMNRNTGEWITNPNPEDCEAQLYKIKNYFNGDISELKEYCKLGTNNYIKMLMGVETTEEGKQYNNVYTRNCLRNGSKSYTVLKDSVAGDKKYALEHGNPYNTVFTNDPIGIIKNIEEYKVGNVKETDLSVAPKKEDNIFEQEAMAAAPSPADDLPFGPAPSPLNDDDPFKGV